jgi:hypothetical protein
MKRSILACVACLAVGFFAGRFSADGTAEGQAINTTNEGATHTFADIITASADGTKLYVWTFHPTVKPAQVKAPRFIGTIDARKNVPAAVAE